MNNGYFSIDSVDCKRIVKFRKRKKVNNEAIPEHLKSGRAYTNFLDFMNESGMPFHLEMDTVIGKRDGKTLLTFNVSSCNFMFALLLDSNTSNEVSSKLYNLKEKFHQNNIHFSFTCRSTSSLDISLKFVTKFLPTKKIFLIFHRNLIFWNLFSVII